MEMCLHKALSFIFVDAATEHQYPDWWQHLQLEDALGSKLTCSVETVCLSVLCILERRKQASVAALYRVLFFCQLDNWCSISAWYLYTF
jgi:hypothetical protein